MPLTLKELLQDRHVNLPQICSSCLLHHPIGKERFTIQLARACAGQTFLSSRHRQVIASVDSSAPPLPGAGTAIFPRPSLARGLFLAVTSVTSWLQSGCHGCGHRTPPAKRNKKEKTTATEPSERKGNGSCG